MGTIVNMCTYCTINKDMNAVIFYFAYLPAVEVYSILK